LVQQETITVSPFGEIYVAYHSQTGFNGQNPDGTTGQVFVLRSEDGGVTFTKTVNQPFGPGQADITFNNQAQLDSKGNVIAQPRTLPGARFLTQGSATPIVLADPARVARVYVITADDPNNGGAGRGSDITFAKRAV
jgi:hypothetical protein